MTIRKLQSQNIFQEKMNELFIDLECVQAYIDDLLITSKGSFEEHLEHIEIVLTRLQAAGLKVCMSKSAFGKDSLKYLGYWITKNGIQPNTKKVQAILEISPPKDATISNEPDWLKEIIASYTLLKELLSIIFPRLSETS